MLTTQILGPAEGATQLAGTDLGAVARLMPGETKFIKVARADRPVGCWALTHVWMAEGVWIDPDEVKSPAVARRLLRAMREQALAVGATCILTGAQTDEVRAMLEKLGATEVPISLYQWPIVDREY